MKTIKKMKKIIVNEEPRENHKKKENEDHQENHRE